MVSKKGSRVNLLNKRVFQSRKKRVKRKNNWYCGQRGHPSFHLIFFGKNSQLLFIDLELLMNLIRPLRLNSTQIWIKIWFMHIHCQTLGATMWKHKKEQEHDKKCATNIRMWKTRMHWSMVLLNHSLKNKIIYDS